MSQAPSSRQRLIGILVFAVVALFAIAIFPFDIFRSNESVEESAAAIEAADHLILELKDGTVDIRLRPDLAPLHAERLTELANEGFYDGLTFHRVIDGFMAQTGDPTGTGRGGSSLPDLKAEFSSAQFTRGTVGMARSLRVDSANSQFFIVFERAPWLDGEYTVVGEVVSGMEYVDGIKRGDEAANGLVTDPDTIISMRAIDAAEANGATGSDADAEENTNTTGGATAVETDN